MTPAQHLTRYPGCRSTTLARMIEREKLHEQLRKEIAARRRHELLARLWRIVGMGRKGAA